MNFDSSKPRETKKEYIIPLIQTNRWRGNLENKNDQPQNEKASKRKHGEIESESSDNVENQAVAELIKGNRVSMKYMMINVFKLLRSIIMFCSWL